MAEKYYITTAIAYTSGKPHIGNTYEIVLADLFARFKRAQGYDVLFQTGTDEHGEKIELKAEAAGVKPQEFVDGVAAEIKRIWDLMDTSYDKFIRTTDSYHEKKVQDIFTKLYEQGDIYKGSYKGWYCTPCESFWTESQLADGKCPDCGREVKLAEEEAYFFRMSKYADRLLKYYEDNPDFIVPVSRKNEMVNNFLKPGLQDLCVSRTSFKWGIPVTFDPKHVVYVWLDALTNYITGLGYSADGNHSPNYVKNWPADLHVIGKDIVRFHTIYWPIFLMALGEPLPKQVFGHPWLLQDGGKMSKSKGNVIYADDLVSFYGVDAVRYFLLSQMPFDNDGVINWDIVTDTVNSELANVYGNLVNRTIAMSNKYFSGAVENTNVAEPVDGELKSAATALYGKVAEKLESFKTADALSDIFSLFRRANKYIDETAPWLLAKDESKIDRLKTVLYNLTETIIIGSSLLVPFIPKSAEKVIEMCGTTPRKFADLDKFGLLENGTVVTKTPEIIFARLDNKAINESVAAMYAGRKEEAAAAENGGKSVENDDKNASKPCKNCSKSPENGPKTSEKQSQNDENSNENGLRQLKNKNKLTNSNESCADGKGNGNMENVVDLNQIDIDQFATVKLKVGEILTAEKVEKADKLLKFSVKVGDEIRTIVSGIAKYYTPEETVGKLVVVVANLKPAKLRGIESQGMLLCACDDENIVLVSPEKPIESGSTVR